MIDPLLSAAMPLPTRTNATEAPPGTPSFLPWALGVAPQSGQGGQDNPLPQQRNQDPGPDVIVDLSVLDAGIDIGASAAVILTQTPAVRDAAISTSIAAATAIATQQTLQGLPLQDQLLQSQLPQKQPLQNQPLQNQPLQNQSLQNQPLQDLSTLLTGSTAETLEASAWAERLSSVIEFQVRNPQGERELVAMPWRLMASGRLAQSLGARGFVDAAMPMPTAMVDPAASAQIATAQPALAAGHMDAVRLRTDVVGPGASAPLLVSPRAPGPDDLAPLPSLPSSSPAAVEWLARWVKWIERDGRDPMVLLRDFRIDDDEARRVVDGLRAFAQEHGVVLDRIVVNGREFWRRPDLSQAQE